MTVLLRIQFLMEKDILMYCLLQNDLYGSLVRFAGTDSSRLTRSKFE